MNGTIKTAVYKYLDSLQSEKIVGGWDITNKMTEITRLSTYPTVILKICKHYAYLTGGAFDCIDRERSIYRFLPGNKKAIGSIFQNIPVGSHVKAYRDYRAKHDAR